MDRDDLQLAEALNRQYRDYQAALAVLAENPRMVSFRIEPTIEPAGEDEEPTQLPASVVVSAEGIQTPPQMMTAIKDQVEARIRSINDQLTEMGVAPSRPSPAPVSAPRGPETPPAPERPPSAPPKPAAGHKPHNKGRR